MISNFEIQPLFATPIGLRTLDRDFTEDEKDFVKICTGETRVNVGNKTSTNNYILDVPQFSQLRAWCQETVNEFLAAVLSPTDPNSKLRITQSWLNFTQKGEFHHAHTHANSILSGSFYFNASENDVIHFNKQTWTPWELPTEQPNIFNSVVRGYKVQSGLLLLFPSQTNHDVPPVEEENHLRISMSFNTFWDGEIGSEEGLTKVKF